MAALAFLPKLLLSQNEENRKWAASFSFGLQAHDKRLFDFPPKEAALARQPETFGAYQLSLGVHRIFRPDRRTSFIAGIGFSTEVATFLRPFDQNYFTGRRTYELASTNRYSKYLVQIPIVVRYKTDRRFGFQVETLPQMGMWTAAKRNGTAITRSKFDPGFYSAEFNAGLNYSISRRISLGLSYRVFQIKKIDKILFNHIVRDPRKDEKFETYNPFKLWLTVGYQL